MVNKLKELRSTGAEEGFTLIELMIVVVIIGILAAIAIPIFANQQKSAIVSGVKSDVKNTNTNIATALVKLPTAGTVGGSVAAGKEGKGAGFVAKAAEATSAGTDGATFDIVVSDSATTITVGGTWNSYKVIGFNAQAFTGTAATVAAPTTGSGVVYQVADGKTVTRGD